MGYGYSDLFEESVSAVTATNSVSLGMRRHYNGRDYVYMYNGTNGTIATGYGVMMSANSNYTVAVTSVTGDVCAAVVHNTAVPTGNYFWGMVRGNGKVVMGDLVVTKDSAQLGALLAYGTDGTFWPIVSGSAGTGTTWSAFAPVAVTTEIIATAGSGNAWVRTFLG
jgi:hypothetical protein